MLRDVAIIFCILGLLALAAWGLLYIQLVRRRERRRAKGRGPYY